MKPWNLSQNKLMRMVPTPKKREFLFLWIPSSWDGLADSFRPMMLTGLCTSLEPSQTILSLAEMTFLELSNWDQRGNRFVRERMWQCLHPGEWCGREPWVSVMSFSAFLWNVLTWDCACRLLAGAFSGRQLGWDCDSLSDREANSCE